MKPPKPSQVPVPYPNVVTPRGASESEAVSVFRSISLSLSMEEVVSSKIRLQSDYLQMLQLYLCQRSEPIRLLPLSKMSGL